MHPASSPTRSVSRGRHTGRRLVPRRRIEQRPLGRRILFNRVCAHCSLLAFLWRGHVCAGFYVRSMFGDRAVSWRNCAACLALYALLSTLYASRSTLFFPPHLRLECIQLRVLAFQSLSRSQALWHSRADILPCSQPCSTAPAAAAAPNLCPLTIISPCLPTTTSSGFDRPHRRERADLDVQLRHLVHRHRWKRGSSVAEAIAMLVTDSTSGWRARISPRQPRSSPVSARAM